MRSQLKSLFFILFSGLLSTSFAVLNLCHMIKMPWVWVVSPLWIYGAFSALISPFAIGAYFMSRKMQARNLEAMKSQVDAYNKKMAELAGQGPQSRWRDRLNEMKRNGAID